MAGSVVFHYNEDSVAGKVVAGFTTGVPGVCRAIVNEYNLHSGKGKEVVKPAIPFPPLDRALLADTTG